MGAHRTQRHRARLNNIRAAMAIPPLIIPARRMGRSMTSVKGSSTTRYRVLTKKLRKWFRTEKVKNRRPPTHVHVTPPMEAPLPRLKAVQLMAPRVKQTTSEPRLHTVTKRQYRVKGKLRWADAQIRPYRMSCLIMLPE